MNEEQRRDEELAEATDPERVAVAEHDNSDPGDVAGQIEEMQAADGASVMKELSADMSAEVAEYLDPETASRILAEMDPTEAAIVIAGMEAPEASMVLAAMDPDDRVDILGHVPAPLHDQLVSEMNAKDAAEVRDGQRHSLHLG